MNKITYLDEVNYDEIFALSQFAFQYQLSEEELRRKKEEAARHIIWGIKDEHKIAAKLHLIPLSVHLNGAEMKMGGISSVATWPEYRRQGMVKDLLYHALKTMKEKEIPLSFLHPFSVPFYRRFGWEIAFNRKHYEIPMKQLKQNYNGEGYVKRVNEPISVLDSIYRNFARKFNGTLIRDEKWWKQRVLKRENLITAVAYSKENEPEGYMIYHIKDRVMKIEEFVHTSPNVLKVLLQYLTNHDSMADMVKMVVSENDALPLFIHEPRFEQKVSPYFMARIVDVRQFLHLYLQNVPTDPFSLQLNIYDDFMHDNSGTYSINKTMDSLHIDYSIGNNEKGSAIHCSVQQLTSIFLGYKRPTELYALGMISGDIIEVEKLENLITDKSTYFMDFF